MVHSSGGSREGAQGPPGAPPLPRPPTLILGRKEKKWWKEEKLAGLVKQNRAPPSPP